jgi:hypothetical protein
MRTTTGAEHFAAIRSYTATAARRGIDTLDALIQAATGNPWIPPHTGLTGNHHRTVKPPRVPTYPSQAPIQSHRGGWGRQVIPEVLRILAGLSAMTGRLRRTVQAAVTLPIMVVPE